MVVDIFNQQCYDYSYERLFNSISYSLFNRGVIAKTRSLGISRLPNVWPWGDGQKDKAAILNRRRGL